MDAPSLNAGLELAMEFGQDWLKPIQSRLALEHPQLSAAEPDEADALCRRAMKPHRSAKWRLFLHFRRSITE